MSSILIRNTAILTMEDGPTIGYGDILMSNGLLRAIGDVAPSLLDGSEVVIDGDGHLAMPGLINTHCHAAMTLLRSYADDMALKTWLEDWIWPAEANLTDETIYWGTKLALAEMLQSGTTCFADMYFSMSEVARAVAESGMRGELCRGLIAFTDPEGKSLAENEALYDNWHGAANDRIHVWFGPHAPNTCTPDYIGQVVAAARKRGAGIHTHLAETKGEYDEIIKNYGKTPTAFMADLGVFDGPTLAAHCVWLSEADQEILAAKHVAVAHNPVSNMKLASGIAPIPALLAKGVTVGLGTDGASSNNSLNMFKDLNICSLLHKVGSLDPVVLSAYETLEMATIGGAKALHLDHVIGSLRIGKKADVIMLDIRQSHYCPWNNTVSDLVYAGAGADVRHVIVDGQILMQDRVLQTMDLQEVQQQARGAAKMITSR